MKNQENVFAVISFEQNKVVAEATHYQEAARICNNLNQEWQEDHPEFISGRLPHTVCRIDALHLHDRKFGKLDK